MLMQPHGHLLRCMNCLHHRKIIKWYLISRYATTSSRKECYYEVLGVNKDATRKEIKKAFYTQSKKVHPDINPKDPANHDRFVKLSEAYTILSNPVSKSEYDNGTINQKSGQPGFGSNPYYPPRNESASGSEAGGNYKNYEGQQDDMVWSEMHKMWMYKADSPYYDDIKVDDQTKTKDKKRSLLFIIGGLCVGIVQFFSIVRYSKYQREQDKVRQKLLHLELEKSRNTSYDEALAKIDSYHESYKNAK